MLQVPIYMLPLPFTFLIFPVFNVFFISDTRDNYCRQNFAGDGVNAIEKTFYHAERGEPQVMWATEPKSCDNLCRGTYYP